MLRILAYLFIALMATGVTILAIVLIWSVFFNGEMMDWKGPVALLLLITWWSWAAISAHKHWIRDPQEQKRVTHEKVEREISTLLTRGQTRDEGIEMVRRKYRVIGYPRHHRRTDSKFDLAIELETKDFTIWLLEKNGLIESWYVT